MIMNRVRRFVVYIVVAKFTPLFSLSSFAPLFFFLHPDSASNCGKKLHISSGGNSIVATIADEWVLLEIFVDQEDWKMRAPSLTLLADVDSLLLFLFIFLQMPNLWLLRSRSICWSLPSSRKHGSWSLGPRMVHDVDLKSHRVSSSLF